MFAFALLALAAGLAQAESKSLLKNDFQSMTNDLDNTYTKIFNSGDMDEAAKYYSEDAVLAFGPLNGKLIKIEGRDAILAFLKEERSRGVRTISITHQQGVLLDNGDIKSVGDLVLNGANGELHHGRQVQLLKKEGNKWTIYFELSTLE